MLLIALQHWSFNNGYSISTSPSGDPELQDGDTYLYVLNQQEFECRRSSSLETPQWAAKGLINPTSFGYRGTLEILLPAPEDANTGNIYSVIDGGIADLSFTGLAGTDVEQYTLIIFKDPEWVPINTGSILLTLQVPGLEQIHGQIKPVISTDNLDMQDGSIQINEFPEL